MSVQNGEDKKTLKRNAFLDAARRIFAQKGYQATNVTDIVAEVKSGQGTFYYHFRDKQAIFDELMIGFIEKLTRILIENDVRAGDRLAMADRALALHNARAIAAAYIENKDLAELFFRESKYIGGDAMSYIDNFYRLMFAQIENGLRDGINSGLLRQEIDPFVTARCIVGSVERAVFEIIRAEKDPDVDAVAAQIVDFQTFGLLKR